MYMIYIYRLSYVVCHIHYALRTTHYGSRLRLPLRVYLYLYILLPSAHPPPPQRTQRETVDGWVSPCAVSPLALVVLLPSGCLGGTRAPSGHPLLVVL